MNFQILTTKSAYPFYKDLYSEVKSSYNSFNGLDFFNLRLFKGDFIVLKNRFDLQCFGLFQEKKPRILITHYKAKSPEVGIAHSFGAFLVANDITELELDCFKKNLEVIALEIGEKILFPFNGHFNLGASIPAESTDPELITFFTSAEHKNVRRLINKLRGVEKERTFYGMTYSLLEDPAYLEKIKSSISNRPAGYSVEKLSVFNYKNDIRDYNRIINESFTKHYSYFSLSFEEEWDLMKTALLVINRNYFRFLKHNNKKIAVSMFFPDYNSILKNGKDMSNILKIAVNKSSLKKVRGVNVAILPEYQGKGLIKYARNENIIQIIKDGVQIIESSYIDQENVNSIENVKSTGAKLSHTFDLYSFN